MMLSSCLNFDQHDDQLKNICFVNVSNTTQVSAGHTWQLLLKTELQKL